MAKSYYITTTIPYVNADPHVGFALEVIRADVLARLHRLIGEDVFYNAGSDEHGVKIYRKAIESGKTPQEYVDEYAARFGKLKQALNLSYDNFIRTTDPKHEAAAQEFWRMCDSAGYIYKKNYKIKYCPGCELEKTDSELVDGKCEFHPTTELDLIDEENYFFKFSDFEKQLLTLYENNPSFVVPEKRQKEITNFVKSGLEDFSISRLKEKMPWGVPIPDDVSQVMYVWFDALVNYISTLGWPENQEKFVKFWGTQSNPIAIQLAGKDNLRQQSCMWQAMLMAVNLPLSKQIFIGDFIQSGGQRMSKSIGNVVDPFEYVEMYGTDALRYYLLAKINPFADSDFTKEKFEEVYQADLANGLGNLVARVAAMAEPLRGKFQIPNSKLQISIEITKALDEYKFDEAMAHIWDKIRKADQYISEKEVWKLKDEEKAQALTWLVGEVRQIAADLAPFMPETAEKIATQYSKEKIEKSAPLFPRLA
jgi:methionyl-tRNA synthetase